jgi:hypothetical protein
VAAEANTQSSLRSRTCWQGCVNIVKRARYKLPFTFAVPVVLSFFVGGRETLEDNRPGVADDEDDADDVKEDAADDEDVIVLRLRGADDDDPDDDELSTVSVLARSSIPLAVILRTQKGSTQRMAAQATERTYLTSPRRT